MEIFKGKIVTVGACSYCNRGKLSELSGLIYPYETVYEVRGKHVSTNFCEDCLDELQKFKDETK